MSKISLSVEIFKNKFIFLRYFKFLIIFVLCKQERFIYGRGAAH